MRTKNPQKIKINSKLVRKTYKQVNIHIYKICQTFTFMSFHQQEEMIYKDKTYINQ